MIWVLVQELPLGYNRYVQVCVDLYVYIYICMYVYICRVCLTTAVLKFQYLAEHMGLSKSGCRYVKLRSLSHYKPWASRDLIS